MQKSISIVMSVYNGSSYLNDAIISILQQTYKHYEFIIINDGSTDNSFEILSSFNDDRIRIISQQNQGLAKSLNAAIREAKFNFVARMDSDDIARCDRFEKQIDYLLRNPNVICCGSWADCIDENGKYIYTRKTIVEDSEIKSFLSNRISQYRRPETPFIHSSVLFKKDAFFQVGGYTEQLWRAQDVALFNKLSPLGQFHNIPDSLIQYRISPSAISGYNYRKKGEFSEILISAIRGEQISELQENRLKESISTLNTKDRQFEYFIYLSKKYLMNNYNNKLFRFNAIKGFKLKPWKLIAIFILLIAYLPFNLNKKFTLLRKLY